MLVAAGEIALADGSGDPTAVNSEDGKYLDKEGNPTYKISPDGTVDWYTYSGYRRYHSECHVCHGPDGMGSSYGSGLKDTLKTMSYGDFLSIVAKPVSPLAAERRCSSGLHSSRGIVEVTKAQLVGVTA